jgi:ketosteroid isomerase-like protein
MSTNAETVERLYRAFAAHDGPTMAACYAPDATFSDPVFPRLAGREVGGMWKMLTSRAPDLVVEPSAPEPLDDGRFRVRWTARYSFSLTKRKVVNHVTSTVRLVDGLIVEQVDEFDLQAWCAQALGAFGSLLGWTGLPGAVIRSGAKRQLDAYLAKNP